ncbi:DUF898 family protein [Primorskyibacter sp. S187A]|uniref:DUF898 family protein n=1 Tax=Primorskyibacter sp. S187A TaxID=3415130 RepID=UPI003C7CC2E8
MSQMIERALGAARGETPPSKAEGRYHGDGASMFRLALKTGALTLITLGIYRFWAKTRIRKYIWSSTELDGARFEYTGTGLEKFLGFLIAIVILAVYLGVIQMLLFFFGLTVFVEPQNNQQAIAQVTAINLSFLAVVPLLYFAVYRARRYKLARTRWRSIRFGMEKGAWGYAFRALGYGLLTALTLGALLPLSTFRLETYMTERSWFGDARFEQQGRWQELYPAMKHLFIGAAVLVLSIIMMSTEAFGLGIALGVVAYIWLIIGGVYYTVHSFRYLTDHKVLNGEITFSAVPRTGTVIGTYVIGAIAISVLTSIFFGILAAVMGLGAVFAGQQPSLEVGVAGVVFGALGYFAIFVAAGAGWLALVVQPIIGHYVNTLTVHNPDAFGEIAQRVSDKGADAEGFADALDIGGAI